MQFNLFGFSGFVNNLIRWFLHGGKGKRLVVSNKQGFAKVLNQNTLKKGNCVRIY